MDTAKFGDAYFKSADKKSGKQSEEGFFAEKAEKAALPAEYVANQKAVDSALMGKLRWVRYMWKWVWEKGVGRGMGTPLSVQSTGVGGG